MELLTGDDSLPILAPGDVPAPQAGSALAPPAVLRRKRGRDMADKRAKQDAQRDDPEISQSAAPAEAPPAPKVRRPSTKAREDRDAPDLGRTDGPGPSVVPATSLPPPAVASSTSDDESEDDRSEEEEPTGLDPVTAAAPTVTATPPAAQPLTLPTPTPPPVPAPSSTPPTRTATTATTDDDQVGRSWWRRLVAIASSIKAIVAFVATTTGLLLGVPKLFDVYRGFSADDRDAVVAMIAGLDAAEEQERVATLARLRDRLVEQPGLAPVARGNLAVFVRKNTRWSNVKDRCSGPPQPRRDVQPALDIMLTRHQSQRRWIWRQMSFGWGDRWPDTRLNLDSTNLRRLTHRSADLRKVSLVGACLRNSQLPGALLDSATLSYARLDSALLKDAYLRDAELDFSTGRGVVFTEARLQGANLNGDTLPGARFTGAELACATFQAAYLDGAHFDEARVQWAFFDRATLTGLRGWKAIEPLSLTGAFILTANLDPELRQWANNRGADTTSRSAKEWTRAKQRQFARGGACYRSPRDK